MEPTFKHFKAWKNYVRTSAHVKDDTYFQLMVSDLFYNGEEPTNKNAYSDKENEILRVERALLAYHALKLEDFPLSLAYELFTYKMYDFLQLDGGLTDEATTWYSGVRILQSFNLTKALWELEINNYLKYPDNFRIFDIDLESNRLVKKKRRQVSLIIKDHKSTVLKRLNDKANATQTLDLDKDDQWLLRNGRASYNAYTEKGERKKQQLLLPPSLEKYLESQSNQDRVFEFPVKNPTVTELDGYEVKKMLTLIAKEGETLPHFKPTTRCGKDILLLDDFIVYLGRLGVGKSLLKRSLTLFLVKEKKQRVVLFESEVQHVLTLVRELKALDLKVVPLFSKNDEKHISKSLESKNLLTIKEDENQDNPLEWIDGLCAIQACSNEITELNRITHPCEQVLVPGTRGADVRRNCPFRANCPKMARFEALKDAEVIVVSASFVSKGVIPTYYNPKGLSTIEYLHDWGNIVLIDEIDGIQASLDKDFITSFEISKQENLSDSYNELLSRIRKLDYIPKFSTRRDVMDLKYLLAELNQIVIAFGHLSIENVELGTFFKEKQILTVENMSVLLKDTVKKSIDPRTNESLFIKEQLELFSDLGRITYISRNRYQQAVERLESNPIFTKLKALSIQKDSDTRRLKSILDLISEVFESYHIRFEKESEFQEACELFLFYVMLCELDRIYKAINYEFESIKATVPIKTDDLNNIGFNRNRTNLIIGEGLIDLEFGYVFEQDKQRQLTIKINSYTGIGRSVFEILPRLKYGSSIIRPKVIGMSGTCYMPNSSKYHCHKTPALLLEGLNMETGEIIEGGHVKIRYIPTIDTDGRYVRTSGAGREVRRNLKKILKNLVKKEIIQNEVKRKAALMVVGNYAEAEFVTKELSSLGIKAFGLTQKSDASELGEDFITKDQVEKISKTIFADYDVFVVSLLSIPRGYNILDEDHNSHFGSIFLLKRPYPVPRSFEDAISYMHHIYYKERDLIKQKIIEELKTDKASKGELLYQALIRLNKRLDEAYLECYQTETWNSLSPEHKLRIAADGFVSINQMGGRTQRNANDTVWYFCDGAMCKEGVETQDLGEKMGESYLDYMIKNLKQVINQDEFGKKLYEPIYNALIEMVNDFTGKNIRR